MLSYLSEQMSLDYEEKNFLSKQKEPIRKIEIAKAIVGFDDTIKSVNPTLYRLAHQGKVQRIIETNGTNPR